MMRIRRWGLTGAIAVCVLGILVAPRARGQAIGGRWSQERAAEWAKARPWIVGFNYIPATAINYTEMWQDQTFDPKTIEAELALAKPIGFNACRCVVQYLVWEHDPEGLKRRMDRFLAICDRSGIKPMFCLFDDCVFGTKIDPYLGKQADVIKGFYANDWSPSPGWTRVRDPESWGKLEAYVTDILTRFKDDRRVLLWDLYNEPTNGPGDATLPLLERVFAAARKVNPSQPLSSCIWNGNAKLNAFLRENVDVVTFHNYSPPAALEAQIHELKKLGRPLICTEWLNRPLGSTVDQCLPVFRAENVGCLHWGLVNGKTQTNYPWGSKAGAPEPTVWQHDIFRPDHTPYSAREIRWFTAMIAGKPAPEMKVLVATAQKAPVSWRYTLTEPPSGWEKPGFDDSGWKQAPAGFGTKITPNVPARTEWTTKEIWIRREFTLEQGAVSQPMLMVNYDEDPEIFINGVQAAKLKGWSNDYQLIEISPAAAKTLHAGKNVIAVHCRQTWGGQFIDAGMAEETWR